MLAPGTTKLYGTWIPRSLKHAPKGITKIVSFGQQMVWKWLHDEFEENFFYNSRKQQTIKVFGENTVNTNEEFLRLKSKALQFTKDMSLYLGMEYDGKHFEELWELGYLPIRVKSLPEGLETNPNIPHMTFVNTVDGFAWLTLYLETIVSSLAWKAAYAATAAKLYRRQAEEAVAKTDRDNMWLVDFMCHDFSARGLSGLWDMLAVGLGFATSFKGSDSLPVIPASRYFYGVKEDEMPIFSVNASEHSVSTTKIFTVGEQQMIADWLKIFDKGILSIVSDTFDLWKLITEYLPANKDAIMARDGKLVIRPDSGDPVDIICGCEYQQPETKGPDEGWRRKSTEAEAKGVIELLWDIFGGTINEQGYKVLDPHIGAIYGDSITPERQVQIYERLAAKGFAATNIVLGVGSYSMTYTTRDWASMAAKGAWFEVEEKITLKTFIQELNDHYDRTGQDIHAPYEGNEYKTTSYNIYKDPVTDDGTKKSLKGLQMVGFNSFDCPNEYFVVGECTSEQEAKGLLQVIYEDGKFYNQTTLDEIRNRLIQ